MNFKTMIAPITTDVFFERHWGRAPVSWSGRPDRFSNLGFDFDAVRKVIPANPSGIPLKAQYFDAAGRHRELAITGNQVESLFDAGMTICLGHVEQLLPDMKDQVRAFRQSAGFSGALPVMCFWSPRGAGFGWHYDEVGVFILQLGGSKKWWFSPTPAIDCPPASFVYSKEGIEDLKKRGLEVAPPRADEAQELVLQPGDMLYLPAGTWHRTEAQGDYSVALTIGAVNGAPDHLVNRCLTGWMRKDRSWSRALPFVEPALVAERVPPSVEQELTARLLRLKSYVSELTVEDLAREWSPSARG